MGAVPSIEKVRLEYGDTGRVIAAASGNDATTAGLGRLTGGPDPEASSDIYSSWSDHKIAFSASPPNGRCIAAPLGFRDARAPKSRTL